MIPTIDPRAGAPRLVSLLLVLGLSAIFFPACASAPRVDEVKAVTLCANGRCAPVGAAFPRPRVLGGVYRLLKESERAPYRICEADPDSRRCKHKSISMFIQGGPIPGVGSMKQGKVTETEISPETGEVFYTVSTSLTFIGVPLVTTSHKSRIHLASDTRIVLMEDDYYTNWMAVGNQVMSFNLAVDYINLDKGEIGGYYGWASTGIGMGKGSGYLIMDFPAKMAAGDDWLETPETVAMAPAASQATGFVEDEKAMARETAPPPSQAQKRPGPAPAVSRRPPAPAAAAAEGAADQSQATELPELKRMRDEIASQERKLEAQRKAAELEREQARLRLARLQAELARKKAEAQKEAAARIEAELKLQAARARMEAAARERTETELARTRDKMAAEARRRKEAERQKAAAYRAGFGHYTALVIGNDDYRSLPGLQTAVSDAAAVARILEAQYGFQVQVLKNATRSAVMMALSGLRRRLTEKDNLLIYYAGHGWLDPEADEGYWLPVDAVRDNEVNWISNASITTYLKAMRAKHVMVVADSCYSGKLVRGFSVRQKGADPMAYLTKMAAKRARVVLASGGLEPVADSGGKGNHSVFASAFMSVLQENASVLDGTTLFSRIRRPVMVNSEQTPQYADIRNAGHDGGDFIFIKQR